MRHYTELLYISCDSKSLSACWTYASALLARHAFTSGHLFFCVCQPRDFYVGKRDKVNSWGNLETAVSEYNEALVRATDADALISDLPVLAVAFHDEEGIERLFPLCIYGLPAYAFDIFADWDGCTVKPMTIDDAKRFLSREPGDVGDD